MSFDENGWKVVTRVILKLLAHSDLSVRLEMYGCCHKYVVAVLGVQQVSQMSVDTSGQLEFLCDTAVLVEIISHGAGSLDKKVRITTKQTVPVLQVEVTCVWLHFYINCICSIVTSCFTNVLIILTY
jgi:hypothetical protein